MPLIVLNTWPTISKEEKKEFIYEVTDLTTKVLKIVPDKIQVLIHELEKENWGKAGAVAIDATFAEKSRVVTKDKWVNQLTQITSKFTHAPLDKVLIVIREMIPGNWGQSGVTGADKDFLSKSRTF